MHKYWFEYDIWSQLLISLKFFITLLFNVLTISKWYCFSIEGKYIISTSRGTMIISSLKCTWVQQYCKGWTYSITN